MKILLVQAKPKTGDLDYNFNLIDEAYALAKSTCVDLCIFPELVSTGYMCLDLFLKPSFILALEAKIAELVKTIGSTALILPTPYREDGKLFNAVLAIQNQKIIGKSFKKNLPNYGIYDEKRYFTSGEPSIIEINGKKFGMPICEDIWSLETCMQLERLGAEILLVPNASAYEKEKMAERLSVAKQIFDSTNLPLIYCNSVFAQDGVIFDGSSFVYDGNIKYSLPMFRQATEIIEVKGNNQIIGNPVSILPKVSKEEEIYCAMVFGLREYLQNNNFTSVTIGLSGGIDSALVTAIAVDAIGASNVTSIMLPSKFTSNESTEDAASIAKMLNITYKIIPINDVVELMHSIVGSLSDLAAENLQARARGVILMAISNSTNSLLLTTGNKSEIATGYATLYGDMCGAFNPIKDIYKTELIKIAQFRNSNIPALIDIKNHSCPVMPDRVITKPPSAELRDSQKDSDYLPEYDVLDQVLNLYIEQDLGIEEIKARGFDEQLAEKIVQLVKNSEFKRYQSAPGVKLSIRAFGRDRRYPITHGFNG